MADIGKIFKPSSVPMTQVGGGNTEATSDYSVRKNVDTLEGTITKVPVNAYDIANKTYVDNAVITSGNVTTLQVSSAGVKLSGAVILMSGANITLSQNAQTVTMSVDGLGTIASQAANNVAITGGAVTGITDLVVADGGTGASTFTDGGVVIGNGTGALAVTSAGTSGQYLVSQGAAVDPVFQTIAAASSAMTLITSSSITNTPTAITISSIAAGYKAFILTLSSTPSASSNLRVWLNNDTTTARYWSAGVHGGTSAVSNAGQSSVTLWYPHSTGSTWGNTTASSNCIMFIDNNTNKNKQFRALNFHATALDVHMAAGYYNQSTEINRIDLDLGGTNTFGNVTNISLWGLT